MRRALVAVALAAIFAPSAQAQTPEALARAEALAAEGLRLYEREPLRAAALFEEAYALSGKPAPLRNAARTYESIAEMERAIDAWERYAAHPDVDASRRAEAQARARSLRDRATAVAPLGPSTPRSASGEVPVLDEELAPPKPPPPEEPSILSAWWFWTAAGAAVLGGVGIALAASGALEERRLCHDPRACP